MSPSHAAHGAHGAHATTALARTARSSLRTWEARTGHVVRVRPITSADFELERDFVHGLSRKAGYQRLMNPRTPSLDELRRWTDIDPAREDALIATTLTNGAERQIGVARYALEAGDGDADFAIVVADAWQGNGVGRQLLACLIERARDAGVRRLVGTTLSENRGMLALAQSLGFKRARMPGAAIYTLLTLDPSSQPRKSS
ncbi:hypothetical protein GCM10023165_56010 [Variovorax defluvii]|uniref:N-acetyltransferase domain-containing protein n=1 Tax=Variovorax defluvii TaxID=913761 RepID=A0ABP8IJ90_9BURK